MAMLSTCAVVSSLQSPSALLQCSVGVLCLLREAHPWAGRGTHSTAANSCLLHCQQAHEHTSSACTAADSHSHSLPHHCLSSSFLSKAGFHHAAVESAGSDEESASSNNASSSRQHLARSNTAWLDQQRLHRQQQVQQQHHHQQHIGQLHNMAGHQSQHTAAHPQQQTRYEGHLHAPHGRRHATSRSQVDTFISEQLLSCKSLGMLRRIMIKHKSTMEPEHVADTLLCLQHLVRAARYARHTGVRAGFPFMHHASQARSQPRVRAAGELSRSKGRAAESDGHTEQLMAQMLGELGSMIWFMMGDMTGPDLAKVLYSWAMLEWHPEPELLADVKASFVAAAAGGGLQQQDDATQKHTQHQQPGQQQWAELELWQGPWMAAGLWGLLKLGEPCEARVLQLVQQHWQQLVRYWTPQQVSDLAHAVALTADEQVAAAVTAGGDEAEHVGGQDELQLVQLVVGLSRHMLGVLGQQQDGEGMEPLVPLPWPESMLIQLQTSLLSAGAAQRAAAAVNEIAASSGGGSPAVASDAAARDVPMMAVQNVPQLAWRMLQALAAVGVNVSEPEDQHIGAIVAALSEATKVPMGGSRVL